ncbi:energy transducer TonB [Opitutus sp. ER46]|uniref:energy transducer TonB n=1 Tax=Opitutus sp. ER46 TaxID=2161864 RepID=UPI000D3106F7|nr:energy transducer TonB [Opitutus sp. ER46]PTX95480.1 hypothetical protein DB354_08620 [Opitutus sp. ER46]
MPPPARPFPPVGLLRRGLVLFAVVAASFAARAAETWIVGQSQHFQMYSSAPEKESRELLTALEQFRANFLQVFPLRGASEPRTTIVLFSRDRDFRPYKPLYEGKPKDVAGYFLNHPDEVTIALTSDFPEGGTDPREVIYHEYVHLLLHVRDARYPLWLDEGLAEVFSTFAIEDGKVAYGQPKPPHVALLQNERLLPLEKLFAVTHDSPEYSESERVGMFYAESWGLTHFLLFGADQTKAAKLGVFLERLAERAPAAASFREVFGADLAAQELALRQYFRGGDYFQRGKPAVAQNFTVSFRPVSDVERDAALLSLRWRIHHDDAAAAAALALLERDPGLARPHELLAAIAAQAGESASALEHWRLAADRGSENAWVYIQLLRDSLNAFGGAAMLDVRLPEDRIEQLRKWTRQAVTLSPDNTEAVELALLVEALAPKIDARLVNRLQPRTVKLRDPGAALLALAIIHWRGGHSPSARKILDLVAAQERADLRTRGAANALRTRLEPEPAPAGATNVAQGTAAPDKPSGQDKAAVAEKSADGPRLAIQSARVSPAESYLEQLLDERRTTAPWHQLPPIVARLGDRTEANAWLHARELRQRAGQGDTDAMFELAVAHACGNGAELSPKLAREWLQAAFNRGHPLAKAGVDPSTLEPEMVAQYLRSQKTALAADRLPPLKSELQRKIDAAAGAADRRDPVILYQPIPRYPEELRLAGAGGKSLVRFIIRADGLPDMVKSAQFTDAATAAAAEECVRRMVFLPTIRDGKPIFTAVEISIVFDREASTKS